MVALGGGLLASTVFLPDVVAVRLAVLASTANSIDPTPLASIAHQDGAALDVDVIHAAIPRLRRALDRLDLPDDGPTRTLADLRDEIVRASDDRLESRYGSLARRLPDLIAELARAGQLGDDARRRPVPARGHRRRRGGPNVSTARCWPLPPDWT